jgi:hypothetical protein
MASAKGTPKVSRISRGRTLAYARKQKPPGDGGGDGGGDAGDEPAAAPSDAASPPAPAEPAASPATPSDAAPAAAPAAPVAPAVPTDAGPSAVAAEAAAAPAGAADAPAAPVASPAPAAPASTAAAPEEPRARVTTVTMPVQTSIGSPPAMPASAAVVAAPVGAVEDPTRMPGPREIPDGHPDDPASPPGLVPRGDSRSLRKRIDRQEFALVYRIQTYVISRVGVVGTRGQWRVVEYPTPSMASHAYAKECSRFVTEGFSDYRE